MREQIQSEAVKIALDNKSGTLDVAVRSGKTFIGLSIANEFDKVLVSYPNISIKESWLNDAEKFDKNLTGITFTTHISLDKFNLKDFDAVILDEIHDIALPKWEFIASNPPKRLYGLSGTVPNNGLKRQYINKYCPIIYSVKLDETVGVLQKDYEIIVHLLEPSTKQDIPLKSGKFWSEKAKIAFWDNKYNSSHDFMNMLQLIQTIQNSKTKMDYVKKLSNKMDRGLIFLETTKQCEDLKELSYHSKDKNSEKNLTLFQQGIINKLSCVKQLSAGITFKDLNECIILHSYASNNKTHQRLARCLQYSKDVAAIHIIGLKGTRDEQWIRKGIAEFDKTKIKYENKF